MRALKTDFGVDDENATGPRALAAPALSPTELAPVAAASAIAAPSLPAPGLPEPQATFLVRALENRIAAASSGRGGVVVALGESADGLRFALSELRRTTARRAIHLDVAATPALRTAVVDALVAALLARTSTGTGPGRPGVAALVDPLIARAASFVLAPDEVESIGAYLAPDALDETPAVAARVLARRFLPVVTAQLPDVAPDLVAALLRARCGGPDDSPEVATVLAASGPEAFLGQVAQLAARSGIALVFHVDASHETPAAVAHMALELPVVATVALVVPAIREVWQVQRSLLSDSERERADASTVEGVVPAPAPIASSEPTPQLASAPTPTAAPTPADPAAPAGAPAPATPETETGSTSSRAGLGARARVAARRAEIAANEHAARAAQQDPAVSPAFQDQLRKAVASRLGDKAGPRRIVPPLLEPTLGPQAAVPATAPATPVASKAAPEAPARRAPDPRWARVRQVALAGLPFLFLASLPLLARMEPEVYRGPVRSRNVAGAAPKTNAPGTNAPGATQAAAQAPPPAASLRPRLEPNHAVAAASPARPMQVPAPPRGMPYQNAPQAQQQQQQPSTPEALLAQLDADLGQVKSVDQRIGTFEKRLLGRDQALVSKAVLQFIDKPPGPPAEAEMFRVAMIERLGNVSGDNPTVCEKLQKLIEPGGTRMERLAALRAIARGSLKLSQGLQDMLLALSQADPDANVEGQARAILISQGVQTDPMVNRPPLPLPPEPPPYQPPDPNNPADPNAAPR